jgi:ribonuclease R
MDVNNTGKVVKHEIFESVIKTSERMTYTNVHKILAGNSSKSLKKYDYLVDDFKKMEELAIILRKKRMDRGAIDFDFEEAKVIIDENGKPVDVKKHEITIANKIIEEFMLLCNETVAEAFSWARIPFVYRVHEDPELEKIQAFNEFIYNFGYHIKGVNKIHPGALQEVLEKVKGKQEYRLISTVMLRSLQKAKYSHRNEGHFGLAAKNYCHFTSPIRRYPDLIIHRIIKAFLKGQINQETIDILEDRLPEIARDCSSRERDAEQAERETVDLKKVEYIKQYEGETFKGIISGVMSFGIFVELESTVEGLVRVSDLDDDYYVFNQKQYCLVGERTKKVYRIGDIVSVKVVKADIAARQVEFIISGENRAKTKANKTPKLNKDKEQKNRNSLKGKGKGKGKPKENRGRKNR